MVQLDKLIYGLWKASQEIYSFTLKVEAKGFTETSITTNQSTRRYSL
jgi:hypothetical protein